MSMEKINGKDGSLFTIKGKKYVYLGLQPDKSGKKIHTFYGLDGLEGSDKFDLTNFNLNSIDILIYFLISFQIFMFGLFTSTLSSLTNFSNDKKIFKFLDFFNLKKSLIICSVFLFSSFLLLINKIRNLFLIYFSDYDFVRK
jgi:hypothetical protein